MKPASALPSRDELLALLDRVMDPEVPVISVVELGIVRDVVADEQGVTVTVTPTYSGCPAMRVIEEEITRALNEHGLGPVHLKTVYAPAWTTDWIGPAAREKLRRYGIAPPTGAARAASGERDLVPLTRRVTPLECPFCGSHRTERRSEFGSTACKAIWFCRSCAQPFEEFKPI